MDLPRKETFSPLDSRNHHLAGATDIGDTAAERASDIEGTPIHQKRAGILNRASDRQRCAAVDLDGRARS